MILQSLGLKTTRYALGRINWNTLYPSSSLRNLRSQSCLSRNYSQQSNWGGSQRIDQSKYFTPKIAVDQFFQQLALEYKESGKMLRVRECPACPKPTYDHPSNLYTLAVSKDSGVYYCHRCSARGSWLDLKALLLGLNESEETSKFQSRNVFDSTLSEAEYFLYYQNLVGNSQYQEVRDYLHQRGFTDEIIQKYKLGAGTEDFYTDIGDKLQVQVVYFPMYRLLSPKEIAAAPESAKKEGEAESKEGNKESKVAAKLCSERTKLVRMKARGIGERKHHMRQYPGGSEPGFFGLNTISATDKILVITEGEFDAMAVHQATKLPAISLPNGATSLPDRLTPYLDQFEKIILWMDNDAVGRMNEEKIAYKLGVSRTYVVRPPEEYPSTDFKDANDFLRKTKLGTSSEVILALINASETILEPNIVDFSKLRNSIKSRVFKYEENLGIKLDWFHFFNLKMKGIRNGEMTIMSGPTGCGKSTFLAQVSITLAKLGVGVLWGSFEIRNQVLLMTMMSQFSKMDIVKNKETFEQIADNFEKLPLYFLALGGINRAIKKNTPESRFRMTVEPPEPSLQKIISIIEYTIEKHCASVVIIDTLQFLLSGQGEGYKKFDVQDEMLRQFRRIATEYNIHIVIVIHPRKTDDSEDIGIHSIYGSSKSAQEADNIWVIQNREGYKIFDLKKNRFDGQIGKAAIGFEKGKKSFFELKRPELEALLEKKKTIEQIIEARSHLSDAVIFNYPDQPQPQIDPDSLGISYPSRQKWDKRKNDQ